MRKNKSLIQTILLRVHYKTSLAFVSIFLGILAFSGFYFFGQNIVNEADQIQRVSRQRMEELRISENDENDKQIMSPSVQESPTPSASVGGISVSPTDGLATPTASPVLTVSATPSATPTPVVQSLNPGSFILGNPNVEKTIVAYYDFECKYCKIFIEETLPLLKQQYFDTGKAKMIFKHFPLSSHANAPIVHNASACASLDGNFWEFHDLVFDKQEEWSGKSSVDITNYMKTYYASISNSESSFEKCVDESRYISQIEKDKLDGKNAGVTGTPTFIIGNEILVGHQQIDVFQQLLNTSN
jgi:protein-disulfide isomerase